MRKNSYPNKFGIENDYSIGKLHKFEPLSNVIIGIAIKVHKELGPGFLESVYEEALKVDLSANNLKFESQKEIIIQYHGVEVGVHRLDLVVDNKIILEIKAVKELADIHFAQIRS